MATEKLYPPLDPAFADRLLDALIEDPEGFRALFTSDPRAALARLGYPEALAGAGTRGIWESLAVGELASAETLRSTRERVRADMIGAKASASPVTLDVRRVPPDAG